MQFIHKIHVQSPTCNNNPPITGPVIRPTAIADANMPSTRPRR